MALNLYDSTSSNNSFDLGIGSEVIDAHFPLLNSNINYLNHVNESGLINSQLLPSNPTIGFHQDDYFLPQRRNPGIGLGQVGFNQRLTEVRRTYVAPQQVQVQNFIEYSPVQNPPSLSPNEVVTISEVTRTTRFLSSTSTMERIFAPNQSVIPHRLVPNCSARALGQGHFQGQPNFRNQILFSPNQVNHPFTVTEPFHHSLHQNRSLNHQTLNIVDLDDHHIDQTNKYGVLDPTPLSAYVSPTRAKNPDHDQNPSHEHLDVNFQNHNMGESVMSNHVGVPGSDNRNHHEYDGRTHSLPCKKFGPYRCPKCKGVYHLSQTFAAHMWSHYKYETSAERKRRLAARYKKRNLRLVYSSEGLTIVPDQSLNESIKVHTRRRKGRPGKAKTDVNFEDEVQLRGKDAPAATEESSHTEISKIKVKEEPNAENCNGDVKIIKKEPM